MIRSLLKSLVTLGVGLLPGPRGTYGSALVLAVTGLWLGWGGMALSGWWYMGLVSAVSLLALVASQAALGAHLFGSSPDPGQIVIDEAAGMLVALYGLERLGWEMAAAFILFRLFDILKPFPVGISQRLPGGWGIVVDDLLAGLYALGLRWVLVYFWGWVALA